MSQVLTDMIDNIYFVLVSSHSERHIIMLIIESCSTRVVSPRQRLGGESSTQRRPRPEFISVEATGRNREDVCWTEFFKGQGTETTSPATQTTNLPP